MSRVVGMSSGDKYAHRGGGSLYHVTYPIPNEQADASENVTSPQLLFWAVII